MVKGPGGYPIRVCPWGLSGWWPYLAPLGFHPRPVVAPPVTEALGVLCFQHPGGTESLANPTASALPRAVRLGLWARRADGARGQVLGLGGGPVWCHLAWGTCALAG